MRLIDADELKEVIYRSSVDTREKIKNIIDNAPTVDIKSFASFSFDKDELNRIIEERVIEPIKNGELVVKTEERPQGDITEEQAIDKLHETGWLPRHDKEMTERPTGQWIVTGEEQGALGITYKIRKCSNCSGEHSLVIPNNFCPNCGAKMTKEAENEKK